MRTAKQWLALGDDLGLELAKVFTPGPWEHKRERNSEYRLECVKCNAKCVSGTWACSICEIHCPLFFDPCTVPDPVDTEDWKLVIDYIRKTFVSDRQRSDFLTELVDMCDAAPVDYLGTNDDSDFMLWLLFITQPRKLWIAAALA